MMMSIETFSCVTPAPSSPGPIRRNSARIRAVSRGRGTLKRIPARRIAQISSAICATPETDTPQAIA